MPPNTKFQPVAVKKPPYSVQVPGVEKKEGEGIPRRHPESVNGLKTSPDPSIKTLYDIPCYAARVHGEAQCMGTRPLIKTHVETKMVSKVINGQKTEVPKEWTFYEYGPFEFINFKQYKQRVDATGAGLRHLGLETGDRLHIFAATSARWLTMSHGEFVLPELSRKSC